MKVLAFLFPLLLLICPPILSSPLTSLPPVFSLCASRASSARAGRYGPAAGQPADGREDELRQRRPDARPGTGRRPDWPVAPGRHTGPRGSRLHPPRELQPAQHWEPGYLLKRWVVGYISLISMLVISILLRSLEQINTCSTFAESLMPNCLLSLRAETAVKRSSTGRSLIIFPFKCQDKEYQTAMLFRKRSRLWADKISFFIPCLLLHSLCHGA